MKKSKNKFDMWDDLIRKSQISDNKLPAVPNTTAKKEAESEYHCKASRYDTDDIKNIVSSIFKESAYELYRNLPTDLCAVIHGTDKGFQNITKDIIVNSDLVNNYSDAARRFGKDIGAMISSSFDVYVDIFKTYVSAGLDTSKVTLAVDGECPNNTVTNTYDVNYEINEDEAEDTCPDPIINETSNNVDGIPDDDWEYINDAIPIVNMWNNASDYDVNLCLYKAENREYIEYMKASGVTDRQNQILEESTLSPHDYDMIFAALIAYTIKPKAICDCMYFGNMSSHITQVNERFVFIKYGNKIAGWDIDEILGLKSDMMSTNAGKLSLISTINMYKEIVGSSTELSIAMDDYDQLSVAESTSPNSDKTNSKSVMNDMFKFIETLPDTEYKINTNRKCVKSITVYDFNDIMDLVNKITKEIIPQLLGVSYDEFCDPAVSIPNTGESDDVEIIDADDEDIDDKLFTANITDESIEDEFDPLDIEITPIKKFPRKR